ncbi:MAG: 50S ribosomal protein L35 [Vampirovibrio sp.]|nr:50S ribosomal protein L35 [Vampirovibrio sp.]
MPKMKTHKSSKKRFRVTATGKIMRGQAGRSHLNQKKTSQQKRRLDSYTEISTANLGKVLEGLPYLKHAR